MHFSTLASVVSLGASIAAASPTAVVAERATSFVTSCTNLELRQNWLIGNCLKDSGSTRIKSAVYLYNKITNNEAKLQWKESGAYSGSCKDCALSGALLNCQCKSTWAPYSPASINLAEHIANYNGHLLWDLKGAPAVPADSSVPVPSDFTTVIGFNPDPVCPIGNTLLSTTGTLGCSRFPWPVPWDQTFQAASFDSNPGFQFNTYNTTDCSGAPIAVVAPQAGSYCKTFATSTYYTLTPPFQWRLEAEPWWKAEMQVVPRLPTFS